MSEPLDDESDRFFQGLLHNFAAVGEGFILGLAPAGRSRLRRVARSADFDRRLGQLVEQHREEFVMRAMRRTGNRQYAEDAVSSALVSVLRYEDATEQDRIEDLESFVRSTIHNATNLELRHLIPRQRQATIGDKEIDLSDPSDAISDRATRVSLYKVLQSMPALERCAVVYRYSYGYSVAEVAEIMALSPKTINAATRRGMDMLRARLRHWRAES